MNDKKIKKENLLEMSHEDLAGLVLNLSAVVQSQNEEIANLKELYKLRTAERYTPSSEQMGYLFEELEILDAVINTKEEKEEVTEIAGYNRKKRKRINACTAPADTPVCDVLHTDGAEDTITGKDGIVYKRVDDKIINKIAIIPRKVVVERHHYPQYNTVDVEAGKENKKILHLTKTAALGGSASLIASIVVSKFDDHLPLYRQEEIFRREGFFLSRQKLASWVIAYYDELIPFISYFKRQMYNSSYMSKDETKISVLNVKGPSGKPSKNGYMYITIGDTYNADTRKIRSLVLLDYIQGRCRDVLFEDVKKYDYQSYIMTDGLKGYLSYEKHCVCWVHAIRQIKQIVKINKKDIHALTVIKEVAKLYDIDREYRLLLLSGEIQIDEFLASRKEDSKVVIKTVYELVDEIRGYYSPKGAMGKAINYLETYKPYLDTYLEVVEATPSNNACEIIAKSFATGRKNWLFSQSVDGADASAFFYSLIETAKRSNLNPMDYVEAVCTFGPGCNTESEWEALLPDKIDFTRLEQLRSKRFAAKSDIKRTTAYNFVGATR